MTKIFQEAFNQTLEQFGIKAVWLSEKTGISNQGISRLRTGERDIYLQTFGKLFEALPTEAKQFFLEKLMGTAIAPNLSLIAIIGHLNPENDAHREQAADAFRLIAEKFIYPQLKTSRNTEAQKEFASLKSL